MKKFVFSAAVSLVALLLAASANAQSFLDGSFVEAGAGVNIAPVGGGSIGMGADLNVGKWFSPVFAVRAGWHGVSAYDQSFNCVKADLMADVLNLFSKRRRAESHIFHWEIYVSAGTNIMPDHAGLLLGGGHRFGFNVTENLQLHLSIDDLFEFDPHNAGLVAFVTYFTLPVSVGVRYSL